MIEVKYMDESSEYYASTCSHVNESEEIDMDAEGRLVWLKKMYDKGLREAIQRALDDIEGRE